MFDTKKFGAYVSRTRKALDMSQSELAEKLNLTRQAISKYECGDSFPDISILIVIAQIFNISLDELIGSGNPSPNEAIALESAASGKDVSETFNDGSIHDFLNIAPLLKPSVLDKIAVGFAKQGIDISNIITLAEYLTDDTVMKLLESATFDSLNEELLAKFIPFLDRYSNSLIFQKILDGELDYKLIKIMIPYVDNLQTQVEMAVLYGVLDKKALNELKDSDTEL